MPTSRKKHLCLAPGDVVNGNYEVIDEVGCGNFAKVYRCYVLNNTGVTNGNSSVSSFKQVSACMSGSNKSKNTMTKHCNNGDLLSERSVVAMKVVKKEDKASSLFERRMLRILNERDKNKKARVSRIYDYFEWKNCAVFIMPLHGLSLRSIWLGSRRVAVTRLMVLEFAYDILETLSFIHFDCRMVHTDLKPENILLEDAHVSEPLSNPRWIICDFGSSSLWRRDNLDSDLISTRPYRAPEVILGNKWHYAADMWSLGCIIYEVAVGHRLFEVSDDNTHLQMMEKRLGRLPDLFTRRSKNSNKFFTPKGSFAHISDFILSYKRPMASIKTMFQKDATFLELLCALLTYDPSKRITAPYALWLPVFDSIRNKKQKSETGTTTIKALQCQPEDDDIARGAIDNTKLECNTCDADANRDTSDALAATVGSTSWHRHDSLHKETKRPASTFKIRNPHRGSRSKFLTGPSGTTESHLTSIAPMSCDTTLKRLNTSAVHSISLTNSWKSDGEPYRPSSSVGTAHFLSGESLSTSKSSPEDSKYHIPSTELPCVESKIESGAQSESKVKESSHIVLDTWAEKVENYSSKNKTRGLDIPKAKDSNVEHQHLLFNSDNGGRPVQEQLSCLLDGGGIASSTTHRENCSVFDSIQAENLSGRPQEVSNINTATKQQAVAAPPSSDQLASENDVKHPSSRYSKQGDRLCAKYSEKTAQNALSSFSSPLCGNLRCSPSMTYPADSTPSTAENSKPALREINDHTATHSSVSSFSLMTSGGKGPVGQLDLSSSSAEEGSHLQAKGEDTSKEVQGTAVAVSRPGAMLISAPRMNGDPQKSSMPRPCDQGDEKPQSKDTVGGGIDQGGSHTTHNALAPTQNDHKAEIKVQNGPTGTNMFVLVRKHTEPHKERELQTTSPSTSFQPVIALPKRGGGVASALHSVKANSGKLDRFSPCGASSKLQLSLGNLQENKYDQKSTGSLDIPIAIPSITDLTQKNLESRPEYLKGGPSRVKGSEDVIKNSGTPTDGILRCNTSPTLHQQDNLTNSGITISPISPLGESLEHSVQFAAGLQVEPAVEILMAQARGKAVINKRSATAEEASEVVSKYRNRTMSLCMLSPSTFMSKITKDLGYSSGFSKVIQPKSVPYSVASPIMKEQTMPSASSKGGPQVGQDCMEGKTNGSELDKGCKERDDGAVAAIKTSCSPSLLSVQRRSTTTASKGDSSLSQTLNSIADFENSLMTTNAQCAKQYIVRKQSTFDCQHTVYASRKEDHTMGLVTPVRNGA